MIYFLFLCLYVYAFTNVHVRSMYDYDDEKDDAEDYIKYMCI